MPVKRLGTAEETRKNLTEKRLKEIRSMYDQVYKDAKKDLDKTRTRMKTRMLKDLKHEIEENIKRTNEEIETGIKRDMTTVCQVAVEDKRKIMSDQGYKDVDINSSFIHVPESVVRSIITGSVYNQGWTLSKAIWGYSKDAQNEINKIIAQGVASGKDTLSIAKDLEKYVMPEREKRSRIIEFQKYKRDSQGNLILDENGNPVPDGRPKKYVPGRVDYNAQRLARTMIAHAYQQAFERVNKKDPFVTGYIWHSAGQHGRTCSVCLDRDGQFFEKDALPMDHPNGMCTFEAYMPDDLLTIANKIADWYDAPEGTYPDIDEYAKDFRN